MKQFTIALLLLLLGVAAKAAPQTEEPLRPSWADSLRATYHYTEGIKSLKINEDRPSARRHFEEALRADSTHAPAAFQLVVNNMVDSASMAATLAERAYRSDTTNIWYHRLYGRSLLNVNRYREALECYKALRRADPSDLEVYSILAALYEELEQPYTAIAMIDSAELRFGRHPYLSNHKRRMLIATNQTERAIEETLSLIESEPFEREHRIILGELYSTNKQDSLAEATFTEAIRMDSTDLRALVSASNFYSQRHNYDKMLELSVLVFQNDQMPLEEKVERWQLYTDDREFYRDHLARIDQLAKVLLIHHPNEKEVVQLYATHQIALGELDEALALYKLHAEDTPPVEDYFFSIIDIEDYLERPDSVDKYMARAIELFPESIDLRMMKGTIHYRHKEYNKAIAANKEALKIAPTDSLRSVIWGNIGDMYHALIEQNKLTGLQRLLTEDQCYGAYKKALKFDHDNVMVLNNWAYFLSIDGNKKELKRALEMAARVMQLEGDNPTYMDTFAWILYRLGRYEQARNIQRRAIALDKSASSDMMLHYGDILHALGEQFMAESYWKRALDKGYDKKAIEERMTWPKKERPAKTESTTPPQTDKQ